MDGWVDGWMVWMDGWVGGYVDNGGWVDRWIVDGEW